MKIKHPFFNFYDHISTISGMEVVETFETQQG
jgi:hypothetical protein